MLKILSEPLPTNKVDYPERLIRDLALGVFENEWSNNFPIQGIKGFGEFNLNSDLIAEGELTKYIEEVWGNQPPFEQAIDMGYFDPGRFFGDDTSYFQLTSEALSLAKKVQKAPIFISYRRRESSALALLILARMEKRRVTPYLDQHPDPEFPSKRLALGTDWEPQLKNAILASDVIILLVGPSTLAKESFIHTEVGWALNATPPKLVIPVLHNGFNRLDLASFSAHTDPRLITLIQNKQGVDITAEDPDGYNTAIEKLLTNLNIRA